jgi:hypothetical protein
MQKERMLLIIYMDIGELSKLNERLKKVELKKMQRMKRLNLGKGENKSEMQVSLIERALIHEP